MRERGDQVTGRGGAGLNSAEPQARDGGLAQGRDTGQVSQRRDLVCRRQTFQEHFDQSLDHKITHYFNQQQKQHYKQGVSRVLIMLFFNLSELG